MLVINVLMDVLFLLFRVNNINNGFIVIDEDVGRVILGLVGLGRFRFWCGVLSGVIN